jgi:hypothetical protein
MPTMTENKVVRVDWFSQLRDLRCMGIVKTIDYSEPRNPRMKLNRVYNDHALNLPLEGTEVYYDSDFKIFRNVKFVCTLCAMKEGNET